MRIQYNFTLLSVFILLATITMANTSPVESKKIVADIKFGLIGTSKDCPVDEPYDNIFHLELKELPEPETTVWLTYELNGLKDHTSVSRSVNDNQSIGGYIIHKKEGWSKQRERINISSLKKGDNVVRFSTMEGANYQYSIQNLMLEFENDQPGPSALKKEIIVNQPSSNYSNNQVYLKGFINNLQTEKVEFYIDDVKTKIVNGTFEAILEKPSGINKEWIVSLNAIFSDGQVLVKSLTFSPGKLADEIYPIVSKGLTIYQNFLKETSGTIELEGARLHIPEGAILQSKKISITALRGVDIAPIHSDMVNTTRSHSGYRMLPHGTIFEKPASIRITYDPAKIPEGYTAEDIRTFYFNEKTRNWEALQRDSILSKAGIIVSRTTHFTDFITGIIKVPESPESQAYTPTMIKDIKAADPSSGIVQIAPPTANNMGTANLTFPIQIPAGRQGMQPELNIQYNSEGGNGWLGLGWDLNIPSISIDTRWGVPRYDNNLETETYQYKGEQLAPVAHRNEWQPRSTGDKQFHPRIEGDFNTIIRHGTKPNDYWWEVIRKDGSRELYGGTKKSVLRTGGSNSPIAQWFLREKRDANGNFIKYEYKKQDDTGANNNQSLGYNMYLHKITYTCHENDEGKYSVTFIRDQQLANEDRRLDVTINCRLGFKKVTASLLRKIQVKFGNEIIRTYELTYINGVFMKKLLENITAFDSNGEEFYLHQFDYYNDTQINGIFKPLYEEQNNIFPSDTLKGPLSSSALGFQNETSMIGGNKANNFSAGVAVTIGRVGNLVCKKNTIGGHYTFTRTKGQGINTLIDINGDNKPDKVFVQGGNLFYRPNLGLLNNEISYGDKIQMLSGNISNFNTSKTKSHSYGPELNVKQPGFGAYASASTTKSKTTQPVYFQDFNADGLVDIAVNRVVHFNRLTSDKKPQFLPYSSGTLNLIESGAAISSELAFSNETEDDEPTFEEENPLHDVVRVWKAPYSDSIRIHGSFNLFEDTSPESLAYANKDGVRVTIEHNENIIYEKNIPGSVFSTFNYGLNIKVNKGDMVFFRLHSQDDGAFDQILYELKINYLDNNSSSYISHLDANGKDIYKYSSSEDFLLVAPQEIGLPFNGSIRIKNNINIPPLSDSIQLSIIKKIRDENSDDNFMEELIFSMTLPAGESYIDTLQDSIFEVEENNILSFIITSNSNVDWQAIKWTPVVEYINQGLLDENGNSTLSIPSTVNMKMFNHVWNTKPTEVSINPNNAIKLEVRLPVPSDFSSLPQNDAPSVKIVIKGPNQLYLLKEFSSITSFTGNYLAWVSDSLEVPQFDSDLLYLEIYFSSYELAHLFLTPPFSIGAPSFKINENHITPFIFSPLEDKEIPLGVLYRNWGQFSYKAEGEQGQLPIDEDIVCGAFSEYNNIPDYDNNNPNEIPPGLDPTQKDFGLFFANEQLDVWQGYDNLTYIGSNIMSSSRLGEDNKSLDFTEGENSSLSAPIKISKTKSKAKSGNISIGASNWPIQPNGSYSDSETNSWQHIDVMDMNGDQYPDLIANGFMQYTNPLGAREEDVVQHNYKSHNSFSKKGGFTAGGSLQQADTKNTFSPSSGISFSSNSANLSQNFSIKGQGHIGLSGFIDENEDETSSSWLDVNGDGLPDLVNNNGQVRLNLGYSFGILENWGFDQIRKGKSNSIGANASGGGGLGLANGKNLCNGSWTFGLSVNKTTNYSTYGHQDVNGDGLVDILTVGAHGNLYVKINFGDQYSLPILWKQDFLLDEGVSVNESVNGAFTICIPIFFIRVCINPKGYIGRSVSLPTTKITDIDGDGYPDLLSSKKDDKLTYSRSTIGRSNLLKTVIEPMGATFSIEYNLLPSTYEIPSSKWLMSKVTLFDGLAGDGSDYRKTVYEYQDGLKDRRERTFLGFAKVISRELDTENDDNLYRTQLKEFANNTYYQKGLLLIERLEDKGGNLFSEKINTYELRNASNQNILPFDFQEDEAIVFPALKESINNYFEGGINAQLSQTINYDYDSFGNIKDYQDSGNGTNTDWVKANITYHSDVPTIKSSPKSIRVETAEGEIRRRETDIDTAGNVIQIRQYLTGDISANHDMEYDDYGNLKKITRPKNHQEERMSFDYEYDNSVHTYVTKVTDAYGYTSGSKYEYKFGQMVESTDISGQQTKYTIDNRGRILTITGPYERAAGKPYTIAFDYHPEATIPFASTKHYDPEHGGDIETYTFMDGLQRPVQVKKTGVIYEGADSEDTEYMIVSGRVIFDAFGRTTTTYQPTLEPLGSETTFNSAFDGIQPTQTGFDVMDRQTSVTLPDNTTTTIAYGFGEDNFNRLCFKTTLIDALLNQTDTYEDIRKRKLSTTDFGPEGPIWTNFFYNPISELQKVSDHEGNETVYSYDLLGRKLSVHHPDAGLTEFKYDLAGNLTHKTTPNIREIAPNDGAILYKYDKERLIQIDYPKNYQNKVQYHYGEPGAPHNRAGRIWLQEDASGGQEFFFGPLGETVKNIRTILVNESTQTTFVTEFKYDTWNRIQKMTYPDGEALTYDYNEAGKLIGIEGIKENHNYEYINRLGYDKFEQRVFLKYGNGTVTQYEYEPERRRLSHLGLNASDGHVIMDNTYEYDDMDNILSITNDAPVSETHLGGNASYNYVYDALYRVTGATGSYSGNNHTASYSLNMQYDNLHNIKKKKQTHLSNDTEVFKTTYEQDYQYEGNTPHSPNKIGNKLYTYDTNGNQTGWKLESQPSNREIIWDEENRIQGIIDNGYLNQYTYDAGGERVIKSHGGIQAVFIDGAAAGFINHSDNTTTYVNPYFTVKGLKFTKHYYVETQRIASKLGIGQFSNNFLPPSRGITAGNKDYLQRMRLLQDSLQQYYVQNGVPPGPPTLPGYCGQPEILGNAIPILDAEAYSRPPDDWPQQYTTPNYNEPPPPPTTGYTEEITNENVEAGFGFDGGNFLFEKNQFFYHSDHLGSTSYITDINGAVRQLTQYTAFGETFVDKHTSDDTQPYLFNAKELDAETALYYYGARYYDPKTSIWQSVDPLAEKYAGWSPYNYTLLNPVKLVDPDGRKPRQTDTQKISNNFSTFTAYTRDDAIQRNGNKMSFGTNPVQAFAQGVSNIGYGFLNTVSGGNADAIQYYSKVDGISNKGTIGEAFGNAIGVVFNAGAATLSGGVSTLIQTGASITRDAAELYVNGNPSHLSAGLLSTAAGSLSKSGLSKLGLGNDFTKELTSQITSNFIDSILTQPTKQPHKGVSLPPKRQTNPFHGRVVGANGDGGNSEK